MTHGDACSMAHDGACKCQGHMPRMAHAAVQPWPHPPLRVRALGVGERKVAERLFNPQLLQAPASSKRGSAVRSRCRTIGPPARQWSMEAAGDQARRGRISAMMISRVFLDSVLLPPTRLQRRCNTPSVRQDHACEERCGRAMDAHDARCGHALGARQRLTTRLW
jgi:hypothetical protein